jgi:hypothetical protein
MKKLLRLFLLATFAASVPLFAHSSFAADQNFGSTQESNLDLDKGNGVTNPKTVNRADETEAFVKSVEGVSDFGF